MGHGSRIKRLEREFGAEPEVCECGAVRGWTPSVIVACADDPWADSTCPKCGNPLGPDGRAFPSKYLGEHFTKIVLGERGGSGA